MTYSLILTNVQLTNAGQYSFFASSPFGTAVSSNALLSVLRPSLSITRANPGVTLSWPTWATNFDLQQLTDLSTPSTTWSNLTVSPVFATNDLRVTLQPGATRTFYRLQLR